MYFSNLEIWNQFSKFFYNLIKNIALKKSKKVHLRYAPCFFDLSKNTMTIKYNPLPTGTSCFPDIVTL